VSWYSRYLTLSTFYTNGLLVITFVTCEKTQNLNDGQLLFLEFLKCDTYLTKKLDFEVIMLACYFCKHFCNNKKAWWSQIWSQIKALWNEVDLQLNVWVIWTHCSQYITKRNCSNVVVIMAILFFSHLIAKQAWWSYLPWHLENIVDKPLSLRVRGILH
jgi:hypothetical protein